MKLKSFLVAFTQLTNDRNAKESQENIDLVCQLASIGNVESPPLLSGFTQKPIHPSDRPAVSSFVPTPPPNLFRFQKAADRANPERKAESHIIKLFPLRFLFVYFSDVNI